MKKYILSILFLFAVLITPMAQVQAAGLTPVQISAIISLLQAFGADQSVIANVQTVLGGGSTTLSGTSPSASLTVNGQSSVTNADPLVSRTWAWSGTPGSTYTASGNLTGCDTASQNGPQSNWKPWTDTKATGNATNGSSSIIPGTVKYGCVITGTYNVTKDGETTTSTATITFKHADGSANTTVVDTGSNNSGGLTITTGSTLHPIQSDHYWNFNLAYTGGTGTPTWSLESGKLPATMELDQAKGTINNNNFFNHSPISVNNHIPEGIYTFIVKVTVGSQSATKQLSLEVRPLSDTRPIIMFGQKGNFAVNEFIQGGNAEPAGNYHFYYFPNINENDVCTIVSGQLPSGIIMKTSPNGCMLSGTPTVVGTYSITWKIENQYGSDTAEYPITVYMPDKQLTLLTYGFPDATVGEPYFATLGVGTTGNWTGSKIGFSLVWGPGGNPGGPPFLSELGLWDIYNNSVQTITTPEPTNAQKTAVISGTPSKAGTYQLKYCAGDGTLVHAAFCMENYVPFIVKPRTQSLSGLTVDIVSAMNSLDWSAVHSVQSATSFKATMKQEGWTLGDVATATGNKEIDVVNTLYPVGVDLRAPDAIEKFDTIKWLIQDYVQTFDWSAAHSTQSAINFKALMDQKGWTIDWVKTAFPFYMGGQDPILTEILKAYNSGTANSSPIISSLSPSSGKAGTTVTINGSGFTGTNSVYMDNVLIDPATVSSSGGLTPTWISFVIPSNLSSCFDRLCPLGPALQTGTHSVFVQNTNGTSNSLSLGVN